MPEASSAEYCFYKELGNFGSVQHLARRRERFVTTGDTESHGPGTAHAPLDLMSLASGEASPAMVQELLREVIDPEIGVNIVDLGLVYDVALSGDGVARIRMTLTTPGCPLGGYIDDEIHDVMWGVMPLAEVPQGYSSKFPTWLTLNLLRLVMGCHGPWRRVAAAL